jgi:molybdopterin-guanine dinucleotide biosynthesis protein A
VTLLVVGEPGSGKTSWCREYVGWRRESGSSVGGILSPAIEKQGQRVGSNALDLLTGKETAFARLSRLRRFKGGEVVGDYTISRDGISFACGAIRRAVESRCDLVVIDEVGPLELGGKGLMPAVELALASAVNVLIVVRSSLKEELQRRFPHYEFVVVADLTQSRSNVSELAD